MIFIRGGSWSNKPRNARASNRLVHGGDRYYCVGLRCVRSNESYVKLRGGSWLHGSRYAHALFRSEYNPKYRDGLVGFRCVRSKR